MRGSAARSCSARRIAKRRLRAPLTQVRETACGLLAGMAHHPPMSNAEPLAIEPRGPLAASVHVPGSKSISNRALLIAALARGESVLSGVLDSDDTRVMIAALEQLGAVMSRERDTLRVRG